MKRSLSSIAPSFFSLSSRRIASSKSRRASAPATRSGIVSGGGISEARSDERKYGSRDEGDRERQGQGKQGDLRPGTDIESIWTLLSYLRRKKFVAEEC